MTNAQPPDWHLIRLTRKLNPIQKLNVILQIILTIGDISEASVQQQLIEQAISKFGQIDVLVNNAGMGSGHTISEGDMDTLKKLMEINLYA